MRPAKSGQVSGIVIAKRKDTLRDFGALGNRKAKMLEGMHRQQPSARRAVEKALLQQVGFDDILDRIARFR